MLYRATIQVQCVNYGECVSQNSDVYNEHAKQINLHVRAMFRLTTQCARLPLFFTKMENNEIKILFLKAIH